MKKSQREAIRLKFNNKCAYCGCELEKGWHVDELLPVRRNWTHEYDENKRKFVKKITGAVHPERFNIDNQNPSCASCNINKHSDSLETFRANIAAYIKHLNEISTQYKIAKRYGLIQETNKPVVFYFESRPLDG